MKVLVIPDVHLKPWMFQRAAELMREGVAEKAVCLMDLPDDWQQTYNIDLYLSTYAAAKDFMNEFPETLWCWGNHDLCYQWNCRETGYSHFAAYTVETETASFKKQLPDPSRAAYIHRIDDVLFMHGGLSESFVRWSVPASRYHDIDHVLKVINGMGQEQLWEDYSPIWLRPNYDHLKMYKPRKLLQVVGHTPMKEITRMGNVIFTDVFSTARGGVPYGSCQYTLVDTIQRTCEPVV